MNTIRLCHHLSKGLSLSQLPLTVHPSSVDRKQGSQKVFSSLLQMDALRPQSSRENGSAFSLHTERTQDIEPDMFLSQIIPKEVLPQGTREFHRVKAHISRLKESKNSAEKAKIVAEGELSQARNVIRELASQIESSNARTCAQRWKLPSVMRTGRSQERDLQYAELLQKLNISKQELSRLKLDVASVSKAKAKFDREVKDSGSRAKTGLFSAEELRKNIEEVKEDQARVELACIEAERFIGEIEAQRETETAQFTKNIETAKKNIKKLRRELSRTKEIEMKLSMTNAEVSVLQTEMELIRKMEKSFQIDLASKVQKQGEEDSDSKTALESAEVEFEEAKKQLDSFKDECFQFMASMDLTRNELIRIAEEANRLRKQEKRTELRFQQLNSKLSKAKSKLKSATKTDERAKAIVSNLSTALQQIQLEMEAAKKEKQINNEETEKMKTESEKTNLEICSAEERLQAAMRELEAAKGSETMALKQLRHAAKRAMRIRALSFPHSTTVTVSEKEYNYLSQEAAEAQVIANKKVEATRAWIDALVAQEKEIVKKTALVESEIKEIRSEEVMEFYERDQASIVQKAVQGEISNLLKQNEEENLVDLQLLPVKPRKSIIQDRATASSRRAKVRRQSTSFATPNARSPSFTIKKRKKAIPSLLMFLSDQRNRKKKELE